jgi:hypothetical protein
VFFSWRGGIKAQRLVAAYEDHHPTAFGHQVLSYGRESHARCADAMQEQDLTAIFRPELINVDIAILFGGSQPQYSRRQILSPDGPKKVRTGVTTSLPPGR